MKQQRRQDDVLSDPNSDKHTATETAHVFSVKAAVRTTFLSQQRWLFVYFRFVGFSWEVLWRPETDATDFLFVIDLRCASRSNVRLLLDRRQLKKLFEISGWLVDVTGYWFACLLCRCYSHESGVIICDYIKITNTICNSVNNTQNNIYLNFGSEV